MKLNTLLHEIRACRICEAHLELGPRPVVTAHEDAVVAIIGQAPGTRVHASGVPWDDMSGDRLRDWMGVDREFFYESTALAIIPMGFCFPGSGKSGDLPPRKECAPQWHEQLFVHLPNLKLIMLVGSYAQKHYLGKRWKKNLTETVRHYHEYLPTYFPIVHPSPRNKIWQKKNPWFAEEVLPELKSHLADIL
ncbi:MAG: uracil-DNA glycosylase family protein [Bacteroidota bacterium]